MSVQGFNFGNGVEKYDFESLDNTPELALQDGNYPDMTVGNADQLSSSMYVEDSVPYLYRTSGGTADIGNREELEIVGGSVVWNQLVQNGDFANNDKWDARYGTVSISDGVATVTVSSTGTQRGLLASTNNAISILANHKYLIHSDVNPPLTGTMELSYGGAYSKKANVIENVWNSVFAVWNCESDIVSNSAKVAVYFSQSLEQDATIKYKNVFSVDLTAMFGSTLADYIYTLETATAGAGVAKLKSWGFFTKDYYAYDAGSLKSVEGLESHDTVGFNQFDKSTAVIGKYIDTEGTESIYGIMSHTDYIRAVPNTIYYVSDVSASASVPLFANYDSNKTFLGFSPTVDGDGHKRMTFANTAYIIVNLKTDAVNDICINLSWSGYRNGEYSPYVKHSYPLDSSLTLRGIPKKDDAGNLYYDGDVYSADGTVTRKYGIVDLGTLDWLFNDSSDHEIFHTSTAFTPAKAPAEASTVANIICPNYTATVYYDVYSHASDKVIALHTNGYIYCYDSSKMSMTPTEFKTAMSGVYLVYELATPTTETADPFQSPQIVNDFGTEEFVTDSIVPVGHNTKYPANLRDKLQHLPSQTGTDGYYAIHEDDGQMTLSPLPAEIPSAPSMDGTYVLKATVSSGTVTLTWDAE